MTQDSPEPFALDVREQGDTVVLCPRGELDLVTAPEVDAAILDGLRAGRHVVLDLSQLAFLDSSGIRALVEARAVAEEQGPPARFSVVRPAGDSAVWRVLEVSGVDTALDVLGAPPH